MGWQGRGSQGWVPRLPIPGSLELLFLAGTPSNPDTRSLRQVSAILLYEIAAIIQQTFVLWAAHLIIKCPAREVGWLTEQIWFGCVQGEDPAWRLMGRLNVMIAGHSQAGHHTTAQPDSWRLVWDYLLPHLSLTSPTQEKASLLWHSS